jgi:hypothetical protein
MPDYHPEWDRNSPLFDPVFFETDCPLVRRRWDMDAARGVVRRWREREEREAAEGLIVFGPPWLVEAFARQP